MARTPKPELPFRGRVRKQALAMETDIEAWQRTGGVVCHVVVHPASADVAVNCAWRRLSKRHLRQGFQRGFVVRAAATEGRKDHIHLVGLVRGDLENAQSWVRKQLPRFGLWHSQLKPLHPSNNDRQRIARYIARHVRDGRISSFGFTDTPRRGSSAFQWVHGNARKRRLELKQFVLLQYH